VLRHDVGELEPAPLAGSLYSRAVRPRPSPAGGSLQERSAIVTHYLSLPAAFAGLLWYTRHQYFTLDDWEFINRALPGVGRLGLFAPHNEHWSTLPLLVYKALFALVGVRSYVPYMAVLLLLHAITAHLMWRIMRRSGANAWIATGAVGVFLVLGSGAENITWAFQIGFVGSLAAGLGMVLCVIDDSRRRLALAWLLGIIATMFSGIGPIMVVIAGLTVFMRRGWRGAVLTVAPPLAVYAGWWLTYRVTTNTPGRLILLIEVPAYVAVGIGHAAAGITGLSYAGAVLLAALGLWVLLRLRAPGDDAAVLALAVGSVLFFLVVGVGRIGLGILESTGTRYVYVAAVMLLPAAVVALSRAVRRHILAAAAVVVGLLVAGAQNAHALSTALQTVTPQRQHAEAQILAAATLVDGPLAIAERPPSPDTAPDLTWADVVQLVHRGDLPASAEIPADGLDLATVESNLETVVTPFPLEPARGVLIQPNVAVTLVSEAGGCVLAIPTGAPSLPRVLLTFTGPASVQIQASSGAKVGVYVYSLPPGSLASPPHAYKVPSSRVAYLDDSASSVLDVVELPPTGAALCGVSQ
jgi:hypothetical protein